MKTDRQVEEEVRRTLALIFVIVATLLAFFWWPAWSPLSWLQEGISETTVTPRPVAAPPKLGADELSAIAVFKKATRSVVFIVNSALRRDFLSLNQFEVPQGSGSGFVWDEAGHIVTNFHVILWSRRDHGRARGSDGARRADCRCRPRPRSRCGQNIRPATEPSPPPHRPFT